nr:hypothetical protein [Tanacetum cinerariifolium]
MADMDVPSNDAPAEQAPSIAPPTRREDQNFSDALDITLTNDNNPFGAPPLNDTVIEYVNSMGYPCTLKNVFAMSVNALYQPWRAILSMINMCLTGKTIGYDMPRHHVLQILWGIIHRSNIDYAERIWEEFVKSIQNFLTDRKNITTASHEKKKSSHLLIPSVRFTKLIIHHLKTKHNIHPRNGSPLHYSHEENVLNTLRAPHYNGYLEHVVEYQRYLDEEHDKAEEEEEAVTESPNATKEASDTPSHAKRSKASKVTKKRMPKSPLRLVDEFTDEGVPGKEPAYDDEEANLQRSLKLSFKEQKTGTSSFDEKPHEEEPKKTNTESEVQSMVTVPIHQDTSSVPPMTNPVIDLTVSQPPPHPLPLAGVSGAPGTSRALRSSQLPPPLPPPSTGTSRSTQQQDSMINDDSIPDEKTSRMINCPKRTQEKTGVNHYLKRKGQRFLNLLRPFCLPICQLLRTTGLLHSSTYASPAENSLLAKTEDITTFMNWYCRKVNKTVLTQADFEGHAYEYGNKGSSLALSISKMKVAHYLDFGLELLVPEQLWIDDVCTYDISARYGISHWWFNRHKFYIDRHNSPSRRKEVRTYMRILSVVSIKVYSRYDKFKDLNLLFSQGHLHHLPGSVKRMLSTAVKLWTRNLVTRQRVEDFQLGIESYQE